ncbi:MAG: Uma2 family endonuclease [Kribbellaceae bacterium]
MGAVTLLPRSRPLTRTDLESVPDDGHRYELIDGALVVTPAPPWRHQDVAFELAVLLRGLCPPDLRVFMAPVDVVLSDSTVMQPDVLVARRADLGARDLPAAPVLAVEVLSPSTKHIDLMLKRSRFEAAGCASYWVVDPDEPAITAWDLADGSYVEVGHASGDKGLELALPFAVTVTPSVLLV